ncbi:maleylpyruvate isomerase family mycothiol-dependent enzyme [Nocardioides sp. GY 10127]|uniref:maleylpyruvate isomerase family mycothiol-dependent enzyme n=1 Tax=Nocardioides sp. GY 10127 TaxID=2569762 RepID=UPI0010A84179|nr:maleylpyruvate isomerase family mycothiol-dependent enzyme [Nocardioides sp. GY 10127]TIC86384.1 maleylpyruvate isomerase family mycothiol-dependent enzyme [Nocardioides sp. GY 10127]
MTQTDPLQMVQAVRESSARVVTSLEALDESQWRLPSLLPGWSVSHVAAHLALNAEALAGAVEALLSDEARTMYASDAQRDDDISGLSAASPEEILKRLADGCRRLDPLLVETQTNRAPLGLGRIERTPGSGRWISTADVAGMRWHELEIHHCDLGPAVTAYSPADWQTEFIEQLLSGAPDVGDVAGKPWEAAWSATGRPPYPGGAASV